MSTDTFPQPDETNQHQISKIIHLIEDLNPSPCTMIKVASLAAMLKSLEHRRLIKIGLVAARERGFSGVAQSLDDYLRQIGDESFFATRNIRYPHDSKVIKVKA